MVFYHYEAVDPDEWRPAEIGLNLDGQSIASTPGCDVLATDAGLPHPATEVGANDWVIVSEGFLVGADADVVGFTVDGQLLNI